MSRFQKLLREQQRRLKKIGGAEYTGPNRDGVRSKGTAAEKKLPTYRTVYRFCHDCKRWAIAILVSGDSAAGVSTKYREEHEPDCLMILASACEEMEEDEARKGRR
jgi:hypothetical protein